MAMPFRFANFRPMAVSLTILRRVLAMILVPRRRQRKPTCPLAWMVKKSFDKKDNGLMYIPVSGLQELTWTFEKVDDKLQSMMMKEVYHQCQMGGEEEDDSEEEAATLSLEEGVNHTGYGKVAHAMRELGCGQ